MPKSIAERIAGLDWDRLGADLDARGNAVTGPILTPEECADLAALYNEEAPFRSRVVMARHGFGSGEYKYFSAPLPATIATLRTSLYPHLAETANRWQAQTGGKAYPARHADYLKLCHGAGQTRPTPLLLKYQTGDYNCLHQDLYGDLAFPLQATILLSDPEQDFSGGEFLLTEQRPRMQSRGEVVTLRQGEVVLFAVNQRPVQGRRGVYRVTMRHGVSRVKSGQRFTLGIIFHDAR
ncbi:2OG-Fe(II) oxygenase [Dongia sp.]|uniref:2OG-Fe(II) oxygenase n=1 Tax=Dongia sp. TaxID=1977262 RepID=UPI00375231B1